MTVRVLSVLLTALSHVPRSKSGMQYMLRGRYQSTMWKEYKESSKVLAFPLTAFVTLDVLKTLVPQFCLFAVLLCF